MGASCSKKNDVVVRPSQDGSMLLAKLNDDLLVHIMSFNATGPLREVILNSLETKKSRLPDRKALLAQLNFKYQDGTSTLTHELPLVCHRFKDVCYASDLLWTDALAKSILLENWNVESLLQEWNCSDLASLLLDINEKTEEAPITLADMKQKVGLFCCELSAVLSSNKNIQMPYEMSTARYAYHELWTKETPTLPAYFLDMRLPHLSRPAFALHASFLRLGEPMIMHMGEPRYRLMIRELVEGRPSSELDGKNALTEPFPKFLYIPPSFPGICEPHAYVMFLKKCRINHDESANLVAIPVQMKRIVSTAERPESGGLCDVTVATPHLV